MLPRDFFVNVVDIVTNGGMTPKSQEHIKLGFVSGNYLMSSFPMYYLSHMSLWTLIILAEC